ncbi:hypothetical protein [Streptomyces virginiae]|uniref:hypothetical protein n=1 Tax=Streptomyces virginiae TaxID=1961 RepID=UPI003426B2B3
MVTAETPWNDDQATSADPEFMTAVVGNMAAVGLPLLEHVTLPRNGDLKAQLERDRNPSMVVTAPLDGGVLEAAQALHPCR